MSQTIDERVVSMQFDNRQFESNVKTSLSTLERLKQSLNLSGASKGLESVGTAAKNCNLSVLGSAAETVGLKFNAMYTMADQALRNITNSAYNSAKSVVKAFTIDPVKSGLSEYETQIGAIQTILANTQSKGSTLDDVNRALDELNTYADKTIYNFTEMTRNIGTFTAAGVDLDKSVSSIKGIANLAAVSGSTSQQASTAMYQLSQALASGTIRLQDWNSVVNAGMGGQVFQDALKRTAEHLGYNVDAMIEKYGSFRESLTQGEWLTAEVLTETLTQLSGAYTEADLLAQGYSEKTAKEIVELAKTAESAATDVKTFTQLMDTLKESAQSGWTQTWELIIGDFGQAKELWSGVSKVFGGMIEASAEARNNLLSGALQSNWEKMTDKIAAAGVSMEEFEKAAKDALNANGYDADALIKNYGSLEEVFRSGAASVDTLKQALKNLTSSGGSSFKELKNLVKFGETSDSVKEIEQALVSLGYTITGKDGKDYSADGFFGTLTRDALKEFQKANGLDVTGAVDEKTLAALNAAMKEANKSAVELDESIFDLVDGINELGGRELIIESFKNVFKGFENIVAPVKKAFRDIFPPATSEQLYGLIQKFHDLSAAFKSWTESETGKEIIGNLASTFKGFFSIIDMGISLVTAIGRGILELIKPVAVLAAGLLESTGSFGEWLTCLRDSIKETDLFGKVFSSISAYLKKIGELISYVISDIGGSIWEKIFGGNDESSSTVSNLEQVASRFDSVKNKIENMDFKHIWNSLKNFGANIGDALSEFGRAFVDTFKNIFKNIDWERVFDFAQSGLFSGILLGISRIFNNFGSLLSGFTKDAKKLTKGVTEILESVSGCFKAIQNDINAKALLKIAGAIAILAVSIVLLSTVDDAGLLRAVGTITIMLGELIGAMALVNKIGSIDKGVTKAMITMVAMATALAIMASALAKLSGLNLEDAAIGVGAIAVLCLSLAGAMKIMQASKGVTTKGAISIIAMAVAIQILSKSIETLGSMDIEKLIQGGAAVIVLTYTLANAAKVIQSNAKGITKGAAQMIPMAAGLLILTKAVKVLADMDMNAMSRGIIGLIILSATLAHSANIMQSNAQGITKGASQMLPMAAGLLILAGALKMLAGMDFWAMAQGLAGVVGILAAVTASMILLSKFGGGSFAGAAGSMILMGVAINILVPALLLLGSANPWVIVGGLLAIAGAFAVLGVAGLLLKPLAPIIIVLTGALALIGLSVAAVGVGLAALAAGLATLATIGAIGAGAATAALQTIIAGIVGLIPTIARELGKGIIEICKVIAESAGEIGATLSALLLAALEVLVECVPAIADSFMQIIVGIMSALAEHTPQIVDSLMQFFISALEGVAARAPELVNAIIGVVTAIFASLTDAIVGLDGATLAKTAIGVALMAALMVLFSALAPLVPGAVVGVLGMGVIIAELALILAAIGALAQIPGLQWLISEGGEMMKSIGDAIGGFVGSIVGGIAKGISTALPQVGTDLSAFMTNLAPFLDGAKSIDESSLTGVKSIVDIITELTKANLLDGIASWITGESSLTKFGEQIVPFGTAIKDFANEVSGLDESAVVAAASAGQALTTLADTVPNTGGLISFFAGDNDLGTFGTQLSSFGSAINSFSTSVAGINKEAILAAATASSSLVTLANTIPNTGGLVSFFAGDNDMATFGTQLKSFGDGLKGYSDSVSGINIDSVNAATNAAVALSNMANDIPDSGGLFSWFSGDNKLDDFGTQLKSFGSGLKGYADEVAGVNASAIIAATSSAMSLSGLATALTTNSDNIDNLSSYGVEFKQFGTYIKQFYDKVSKIDATKFSSIATSLTSLSAISGDGSGLKSFVSSLGSVGTSGVDSFIDSFSKSTTRVNKVGADLIANLMKGVNSKSSIMATTFKGVVNKVAATLKTSYASFQSIGKYLVQGFANGISANTYLATAKAKAMAQAAEQAARKELQVKSPSRKFYQIGSFVVQGFTNAISDKESAVYKAGGSMGEAVQVGMKSAISKVQELIDNDLDTQPTIRPVLDLSDVSSGAGAIANMLGVNPSIGVIGNIGAISSMMNNQNGTNDDLLSAIKDLGDKLGNISGNTYNVSGITYDDGSNITNAVKTIVRAARMERRV
jgi:tape measure domain-containing protein